VISIQIKTTKKKQKKTEKSHAPVNNTRLYTTLETGRMHSLLAGLRTVPGGVRRARLVTDSPPLSGLRR
jgi:hypothetical protein